MPTTGRPERLPERRPDGRLDVALLGATGSVGRVAAAYLAAAAPAGARIGLAGRSPEALGRLRDTLPERAATWPLLVADTADDRSLDALAESARVVATTVGPYARHGLPVVAACTRAGAHYADVTGETLFVRESIDRFHAAAAGEGTRVVHACGFDAVPSDLAALLLADRARTGRAASPARCSSPARCAAGSVAARSRACAGSWTPRAPALGRGR
nr:saccharopine dehydrogenase NADP-binding domain-containing protein [Motilibacter aurantiacus]